MNKKAWERCKNTKTIALLMVVMCDENEIAKDFYLSEIQSRFPSIPEVGLADSYQRG